MRTRLFPARWGFTKSILLTVACVLPTPALADHCWTSIGAAGIPDEGSAAEIVTGSVTQAPVVATESAVANPYGVGVRTNIEDGMVSLADDAPSGTYTLRYNIADPHVGNSLQAWIFVGDPDADRVVVMLKRGTLDTSAPAVVPIEVVAIVDTQNPSVQNLIGDGGQWVWLADIWGPDAGEDFFYFIDVRLITEREQSGPFLPDAGAVLDPTLSGPALAVLRLCSVIT